MKKHFTYLFILISLAGFGQTSQTITFAALPGKTFGDPPFTLSATASSGLPVTFTRISGAANISGTTLTITGAGTITVRASQAGNETYAAATPVDRSFVVAKASQTITLNNYKWGNRDRLISGANGNLTFRATASSGLPVSYTIISGPATVAGNTLIPSDLGTVIVEVTQPSNANYFAAPAKLDTFDIVAAKLIRRNNNALNKHGNILIRQ